MLDLFNRSHYLDHGFTAIHVVSKQHAHVPSLVLNLAEISQQRLIFRLQLSKGAPKPACGQFAQY